MKTAIRTLFAITLWSVTVAVALAQFQGDVRLTRTGVMTPSSNQGVLYGSATEGGIFRGSGSTSDFALKASDGTTVAGNIAGTQTFLLTGSDAALGGGIGKRVSAGYAPTTYGNTSETIYSLTSTGNAAGASTNITAFDLRLQVNGAVAYAGSSALSAHTFHNSTTSATTVQGGSVSARITNSGSVNTLTGLRSALILNNSGSATTGQAYRVVSPTLSSTGAITTNTGLQIDDIGHASLVTNAVGINIADQTGSVTSTRGIRSQVSSGTGKHNLYIDGSADSYIKGPVFISDPTSQTYSGSTARVTVHGSLIQESSIAQARYNNGQGAPFFTQAHSRGTSVGTFTALQTNDDMGVINWQGTDGTTFQSGAKLFAAVDAGVSQGTVPGRFVFQTANASGTLTERLRIDSAGLTTVTGTGVITGTANVAGLTLTGTTALTPASSQGVLYASTTSGGVIRGSGTTYDVAIVNQGGSVACGLTTNAGDWSCSGLRATSTNVLTPASSSAVFYGASGNGGIMRGSGSTNDISLVNQGGTAALIVARNTTNVAVGRHDTLTNCADGTATPADCTSASAGAVIISAAATAVTVNTTAVTANSQIFIQEDSSLGTRLGVTCNTTIARTYAVTARTAGTSFVITSSAAPVTNPACLNFLVVN